MSEAMLCPACRVPLTMSERQNIEIDYCPQCRGVWLDRGELDKIIERSASDAAATPSRPAPQSQPQPQPRSQPQPGYPSHDYSHGGHHGHQYPYRKRKKSFLEDLFD